MAIKTFKVYVSTTTPTDIIDITPEIERIAAQAGDGPVLLFVPESTASLTTIEYESGAVAWHMATDCCLWFWQAAPQPG